MGNVIIYRSHTCVVNEAIVDFDKIPLTLCEWYKTSNRENQNQTNFLSSAFQPQLPNENQDFVEEKFQFELKL